jgi:hypothetical protein
MTSHLYKWSDLFPQVADLRSWLCTAPLPAAEVLPEPPLNNGPEVVEMVDEELFDEAVQHV